MIFLDGLREFGEATDRLTRGDVLAIHQDQIRHDCGADGLRDPGQSEAARFRPQSGCYSDPVAATAALWESLSQNHPIVDGSKRTALAAMFAFLAIDGIVPAADADGASVFMSGLHESGLIRFAALEEWLRRNCGPAAWRAQTLVTFS